MARVRRLTSKQCSGDVQEQGQQAQTLELGFPKPGWQGDDRQQNNATRYKEGGLTPACYQQKDDQPGLQIQSHKFWVEGIGNSNPIEIFGT